MKKIFILLFVLSIIGCNKKQDDTILVTEEPIIQPTVNVSTNKDVSVEEKSPPTTHYVYCLHKHDMQINFRYFKKDLTKKHFDNNIIMYIIKDTKNKMWYLNNYEIENYDCTENF